jgi:integrase
MATKVAAMSKLNHPGFTHPKKQRAKPRVYDRPDFKPLADHEGMEEIVLKRKSTPHDLKIARYRDRLLALAIGRMSPEMFTRLESHSGHIIDKLPDNSEIALYSDFVQFMEFCTRHEETALPFQDYVIDRYLSYLMAEGKTRTTIDRHLASLAKWARFLELNDPRGAFKVQMRVLELRKKASTRTRQAQGLRATHLNAALDVLNPLIPRDCQDITLLFVGWETMCRRSELVKFTWGDFELQNDGSGLLYLEASKTDQDRKGDYLYLSPYTTNILLGWRTRSKPKSTAVAIFRGIFSNGKIGTELSTKGVERCYQRIAERLGLPKEIFSGHSTRVGSAQEMIERDIDSAKIMLSGRWKSMSMLTRYAKKINAKKGGMADLTRMLEKELGLANNTALNLLQRYE